MVLNTSTHPTHHAMFLHLDTSKLQKDINQLGKWVRKWGKRFQPPSIVLLSGSSVVFRTDQLIPISKKGSSTMEAGNSIYCNQKRKNKHTETQRYVYNQILLKYLNRIAWTNGVNPNSLTTGWFNVVCLLQLPFFCLFLFIRLLFMFHIILTLFGAFGGLCSMIVTFSGSPHIYIMCSNFKVKTEILPNI